MSSTKSDNSKYVSIELQFKCPLLYFNWSRTEFVIQRDLTFTSSVHDARTISMDINCHYSSRYTSPENTSTKPWPPLSHVSVVQVASLLHKLKPAHSKIKDEMHNSSIKMKRSSTTCKRAFHTFSLEIFSREKTWVFLFTELKILLCWVTCHWKFLFSVN